MNNPEIRLGIIPKDRFYICSKCDKLVDEYDMKEEICPCCGTLVRLHKKCGGRVYEFDPYRSVVE